MSPATEHSGLVGSRLTVMVPDIVPGIPQTFVRWMFWNSNT